MTLRTLVAMCIVALTLVSPLRAQTSGALDLYRSFTADGNSPWGRVNMQYPIAGKLRGGLFGITKSSEGKVTGVYSEVTASYPVSQSLGGWAEYVVNSGQPQAVQVGGFAKGQIKGTKVFTRVAYNFKDGRHDGHAKVAWGRDLSGRFGVGGVVNWVSIQTGRVHSEARVTCDLSERVQVVGEGTFDRFGTPDGADYKPGFRGGLRIKL